MDAERRLYLELRSHMGHDLTFTNTYEDGSGVSLECRDCGCIEHIADPPRSPEGGATDG